MPLDAPNLDDRQFAQLVEEARALIPRYTPEWTDHNLSDPGITLVQLFAWLGEVILYRLNRVPDRNYIKFLQMIGVEQKPATPARTQLTITLTSPDLTTIIVPKETQVSAEVQAPLPSVVAPSSEPTDNSDPVIFETDEPLIALGAQLKYVQVFDGINYVDYSQSNTITGEHYAAFGVHTREGSAVLLGFTSNNAFPTVEINLTVRLYFDPTQLQEQSSDTSSTAFYPPATIVWQYWDGGEWRKLDVVKDETRAFTSSGHVYFNGPRDIVKAIIGAITNEQCYWLRASLVMSQYELPPELDALLINTVWATAVTTVRNEVVGASNGQQPGQVFRLRNATIYAGVLRPVEERLRERAQQKWPPTEAEQALLDKALRERELSKMFLLEVNEGLGFAPWEEVEDFFNSQPDDRHYTLNRTTGDVTFGDGKHGRIPVAGIDNIVARYYRYGGGARGNIGAATATNLLTSVASVDTVTNLWSAEGGMDEELLQDTRARAPKELKARDRAVTTQDFEFLALQTPGARVRRAHALPLYHPRFPDVEIPGCVTVIIVPESGEAKPLPSQGMMQTVLAYLNQHRLITSELVIAPPKYSQIKIEATVLAKPTADVAMLRAEIAGALTTYLHPLAGGNDGLGWPLGGPVYYSEIFRVILRIDDVQSISDMRIVVDGERKGRCEDVAIPRDYLVFSAEHDINVQFTPLPG